MTDAKHTHDSKVEDTEGQRGEMHRMTVDDPAGSRSHHDRGVRSSSSSALCFRRFDLLVLANHLYLLISLGYLSLDSLRLVMSTPGTGAQSASAMMGPEMGAGGEETAATAAASRLASARTEEGSNDAAATSHLHFVLISDTCMLLLAALFVVDACMFAFVHARAVYAERSGPRLLALKQHQHQSQQQQQQQQQQHAVQPTITSLRVESATTSPGSASSSGSAGGSSSSKYSAALSSPERQTLLLASLSLKLAASSPPNANSSVHVELAPFIARRNSAQVAADLFAPEPASRRYRFFPLLSLFLSSSSGVAELLNILGGLGYLLSSLIPFLFFLVSEPVERSLDRAANVVDNLAMGVFVVDSWLYLALWSSKAKRSGWRSGRREVSDAQQREDEQSLSEQHQERQGLIAQVDHASASAPGSASTSLSTAPPSSSSSTASPSGRRSTRLRPSASASSLHRSLCDRRTWDLALASNFCNILAGVFYLSSTIYGFVIRVKADAELHGLILQAAEARDAAGADPSAPAVPAAATAAWMQHAVHSSWQQASLFLFFQSASRSSRRDPLLDSSIVDPLLRSSPAYHLWARDVEEGFHRQQCLALVGDLMYFLCALAMEAAYYSEQNRSRQRGKQEEHDEVEEEEETEEELGTASEPATDAEDDELDPRQPPRRSSGGIGIHLDASSDSDNLRGAGATAAAAPQFSPLQLQLLTPVSAVSSHGSATPASFVLPSTSPPACSPSPMPPSAILRHPHPHPQALQPQYSPIATTHSPQPAMPFPINAVLAEAQQRQSMPRTTMLHGASAGASTPVVSSTSHVIAVDARDASFSLSPMSPPNATSTPHSNAGSRCHSRA